MNKCFRCREDCKPLTNISSLAIDGASIGSFICVGHNDPSTREFAQDRFTLCWKNDVIDERGHWDKRDLLDTMSVIAQALSIDENIRVSNDLSEEAMQTAVFRGEEDD